jgi:hypothetical protein
MSETRALYRGAGKAEAVQADLVRRSTDAQGQGLDRVTDLLVAAMASPKGDRWALVRQGVAQLYQLAVRDAQAGQS